MDQYITVFNRRTAVAMIIAIVTLYFSYRLNINYNIDLTLISIAIVFPLVFTIRSSFRRREKALEHLSQFRAAIKTLDYFFMSAPTLTDEKKAELSAILLEISDQTMNHLNEVFNVSPCEKTLLVNRIPINSKMRGLGFFIILQLS